MPYGINMPLMQAAVKSIKDKVSATESQPKEPPKRGGWDDLSYYDRMAEYMYYHKFLQDELQKRNPVGVGVYQQQMKELYDQQVAEHGVTAPYYDRKHAQEKAMQLKGKYKGELSEDDVKNILGNVTSVGGQNPYERFKQLRDEAFAYDMGLFKRSKPIEGFSLEEYMPMVASSIEEEGRYYRPEIKEGRLVRRTNQLKPVK